MTSEDIREQIDLIERTLEMDAFDYPSELGVQQMQVLALYEIAYQLACQHEQHLKEVEVKAAPVTPKQKTGRK